ncbi:MAG: cell division protein FtsQ/DivIB [Gammaproteobacteria bacterium]
MSQAIIKVSPAVPAMPSPTVFVFVLMLLATIAGLGWAIAELRDPAALPIRRVQIEGEFLHLDPERLQRVVVDVVDAGFFGVDVARIRDRLLEDPWIREATIRRVWPESLRVSIVEQVPVARWGDFALLNTTGDIFAPDETSLPDGLVRLRGPLGTEDDVLEHYRRWAAQLEEVGLSVVEVRLSARLAWTLQLGDGKELELGRRDLESRLARFLRAYRAGLEDVWMRIGRVDLRYTNGFAVSESRQTRAVLPEEAP